MKNHFSSLLVLLAIAACTPKPANTAPVAQFTLPTGAVAGQPVAFSSSATDADGDALTQTWSFGDGGRGGGANISHLFAAGGTYPITLTVSDGQGGTNSLSANLQVAADAPAGAPIAVQARVRDASGAPLAGVQARLEQTLLGTTDATGNATVSLPTAKALSLHLSKAGYAEHFVPLEYAVGSTSSNAYFDVVMLPRNAAQPLNATQGGTLAGEDGAQLQLPANALEREDGTPISGTVNVAMTPVDVTNPAEVLAFPGDFAGLEANGTRTGIVSLGTTEFAITQGGERLNLRPGTSATVRLPMYANSDLSGAVYAAGSTVPLWSLDEKTGIWVQEGTGTVVSTATGLVLEAKVGHFSWWNADIGFTPSRPRPRCINDTPGQYDDIFTQAVFCKFLAEMDRPIPPQNARANPPRLPSYAATTDIPMGGGVPLVVPADADVRYTACIAGGQFCGTVVRRFAANASEAFDIRLKRVEAQETITLPFDETRLLSGRSRFVFAGSSSQNGVKISFERPANSNFIGSIKLTSPDGSTILTQAINANQIIHQRLVATANHTLEVTATEFGSVRIRVERINIEDISLPFDATRTLDTRTRFVFASSSSQNGVKIRLERPAGSSFGGAVLLQDPSNTEIATGNVGANTFTLEKRLFISGNHVLEIAPSTAGSLRVRLERVNLADTGAWQTVSELPDGENLEQSPILSINPDGHGTAVWARRQNTASALNFVMASGFDATANAWSAPVLLEQQIGERPNPTVSIGANRDSMALWSQQTSQGARVLRWARQPAGGAWSPPATLETASSGRILVAPQVFVLPNGNAVAVLSEEDPFVTAVGNQIRLAFYTANSNTWAMSAIAPTGAFVSRPILQLETDGTPRILYATSSGVQVRRYSSNTWEAAQTVFAVSALPNALSMRYLMTGTGQAIAALQESNGNVRLRASDGAVWKPEQSFVGNGLEFALDSAGNATWVYPELTSPSSLFVRTYTASTDTWSAAQSLSSGATGGVIAGADFVQLAINASNDAAIQFIKQIPNQLEQTSQFISRAGGGAWSTPSNDTRFNFYRLGLDNAGRAVRLRFGFNNTTQKYVLQARRDSLR